jgi:hypothetical protein
MSQEFRQVYRAIDNLTKRIGKLEEQMRYKTATDWAQASWWGWCSPTQPISRSILVRGGVFWIWDSAAGTGNFRKLDDTVFSFDTCLPFNIGGAYRWSVLRLNVTNNPPLFDLYEIGDGTTEFLTADDCENDFWLHAIDDDIYGGYIPLCAVILKNDTGVGIGPAGACENITLSDTDYSYMLARDFRPWLHLHAS